jgi:transcription elongation GreA/GreB family factor
MCYIAGVRNASEALKLTTIAACKKLLDQRMAEIQKGLEQAKLAVQGEDKSSAGDKYETGRAMGHLEQERLGRQYKELHFMMSFLNSCEQQDNTGVVKPGSLLRYNDTWVFVAVGLGKVMVDDKTIFVVSPEAPLGKVLVNLKKGDAFTWNKNKAKIEEII